MIARCLLSSVLLVCACAEPSPPSTTEPPRFVTRDDGRVDLVARDGTIVLRGAWAEARIEGSDHDTRSCGAPFERVGEIARLSCPERDGATLTWELVPAGGAVEVRLRVHATRDRRVERLTPLLSTGSDGGLFVGTSPTRVRVLDNGSSVYREAEPALHAASEPRPLLLGALGPAAPRGNVVSMWDHAVVDLGSGRSWIAGALEVERSIPTFGTAWSPSAPPVTDDEGRAGITTFVADQWLAFGGRLVRAGETLASDAIWVLPDPEDPWSGLEQWADAAARRAGRPRWIERERRIPAGWNSWSGSSFSGGLGTDIDEAIVLENLEILARELAPYGVEHFQIDDGWQARSGDWTLDPIAFPSGMSSLVSRIEDRGLIPGLWLEPFVVSQSSEVAQAHPEWLRIRADHTLAGVLVPSSGEEALDLSRPEVIDWVGSEIERVAADGRLGWMKLDFTYLALPYDSDDGASGTAVEHQRRALRTIRQAAGDETFLLGIGMIGLWLGVADGMRLTLDDGPRWEQEQPFSLTGNGGSFQSAVLAGAHRWYLGRIFVPHDDLLFFRTAPGAPPVTLGEAITFASFIGLSEGIVKIGEDMRTLAPEHIDVIRRLLPPYPVAARPIDVFERRYPEVYVQPIEGTLAGSDARWWVIGLLNWGRNYDHTASPPAEMADEARRYELPLDGPALRPLGLDAETEYVASELWTGRDLGVVRGVLSHEVAARGHALIALRPLARDANGRERPQLFGNDRHVTQGGTDLVSETWDAGTRRLEIVLRIDEAPQARIAFEHTLAVRVPAGSSADLSTLSGASGAVEGSVLRLRPTASGPAHRIAVTFR